MRQPERRLIAVLVGIGVTGVAMLSKVTAILGFPGWLAASLVGRLTPSLAAFYVAGMAGNFLIWALGTYAFLAWRDRHESAA